MTTALNYPDDAVKHARFELTRTLPRATASVAAVSGVVITAVALLFRSVGVSLAAHGEIPLAAFTQFTIVGAAVGGTVLALMNRFSASPRRRFLQLSIGFTALSCLVPAAFAQATASKIALAALHLLAASIIVPVLVRHAN